MADVVIAVNLPPMSVMSNGVFRDGVLLRREALEIGIDDKSLNTGVRNGILVRIRQGAYAERQDWDRLNQVARHRVLMAGVQRLYGHGVVLSHTSGIVEHDGPTWGLDLSTVHITHANGTGRTQGRVRHHCGLPRPDDVVRADGHRVSSIARTVVQRIVDRRSTEVGVGLASHFLHSGQVSLAELVAARLDVGDAPGSLILRSALAYADPRLESVGEARCWYVLCRAGLPPVTPQYPVARRNGAASFYLDFAIPGLGVWIEFDGKEKYFRHRRPGESMEEFLLRERDRENEIREMTGWDVIRLRWADLDDPQRIVARINAVVARRVR